MADLATVRTEIKTWERVFKDSQGRPPTLDDIKANNAIANKYKLYKRLSKAAALSVSTQPSKLAASPSTPPRPTHAKASTSILRSTSRPVEPSAPLAAFNPFSPQKKAKDKGKDRDFRSSRDEPSITRSQLTLRGRSPSPDLSPPKQQSDSTSSATALKYALPLPSSPVNAVSRARKRLRGEPVSPSPSKEKRRRVSSQTTLSFPRLNLDVRIDDEQEGQMEVDSSFVDNSPIKAPKTGKSFPALFEHDVAPVDLFGVKSNLEIMNVDTSKPTDRSKKPVHPVTHKKPPTRASNPIKTARVPTASADVEASDISAPPTHSQDIVSQRARSEGSSNRSSMKRALSEDIDNGIAFGALRTKPPLLPPSPPPANTQMTSNKTGKLKSHLKGKSKSRKKSKLDGEPMEDDDSDGQESKTKFKMVRRHDTRPQYAIRRHDEDGVVSDSDPNLGQTRFSPPRAATPSNSQLEDGDVEIDLPEQLRSVLALDSIPTSQVSDEDRLVKGLLYGRRVTHYDPSKGGEIWDIGENDDHDPDDEHPRHAEGEDDWEGEPVPWEVGEL
ncbi:hypothetical protein HYPSUDRAFT_37273 [Hypholoma sublateritium FD-334 SS-4]|uniref:DNA replication regulator SLD2 n=1 Tax=Hypholoma sublateritium (strain FD-334 SS-4) TaxID=945553 RepID=A0A0D2PB40_HYPSF|nr:hypothetical protein HYPSUDRAFT_37273 [Hypholoma sublateritium FD-334 SS-4]